MSACETNCLSSLSVAGFVQLLAHDKVAVARHTLFHTQRPLLRLLHTASLVVVGGGVLDAALHCCAAVLPLQDRLLFPDEPIAFIG